MIHVIFTLVIIGLVLWMINSFIPMDAKVKQILNVVVVILILLWLLRVLGGMSVGI